MQQIRIPAALMRGGTSKGLFFRGDALPRDPALRDRVLLRAIGSPDPYRKQIDGLGGATSSTSKVVIVSRSARAGCDVDYLFGAVAIDAPVIDWSGSCGNLVAGVGPFAIEEGLMPASEGMTVVRIWQANTGKRIVAHVPTRDGAPLVAGDCRMDGVPFSGAEIRVEFFDPGGAGGGALLPTGRIVDRLHVAGVGDIEASLVDAGNPTVFVRAGDIGLAATELAPAIDGDPRLLARLEAIRASGAVAMGLAASAADATARRPATPKLAFVAPPVGYETSAGERLAADDIDVTARIMSMGRLHHAFTGTGSVAAAVAGALPGSIVSQTKRTTPDGEPIRIGHPAGRLEVGATVVQREGRWVAEKAVMRRTARRLMEGSVLVPAEVLISI